MAAVITHMRSSSYFCMHLHVATLTELLRSSSDDAHLTERWVSETYSICTNTSDISDALSVKTLMIKYGQLTFF